MSQAGCPLNRSDTRVGQEGHLGYKLEGGTYLVLCKLRLAGLKAEDLPSVFLGAAHAPPTPSPASGEE